MKRNKKSIKLANKLIKTINKHDILNVITAKGREDLRIITDKIANHNVKAKKIYIPVSIVLEVESKLNTKSKENIKEEEQLDNQDSIKDIVFDLIALDKEIEIRSNESIHKMLKGIIRRLKDIDIIVSKLRRVKELYLHATKNII